MIIDKKDFSKGEKWQPNKIEARKNGQKTERERVDEAVSKAEKKAYEDAYEAAYRKGMDVGINEGRERGYKDGYDSGKAKVKQKTTELKALIESLNYPLTLITTNILASTINLSKNIASRIIGKEVETSTDFIVEQISNTLINLPNNNILEIKLNSDDYQTILNLEISEFKHIKLVPNKSLDKGSAVVNTENGMTLIDWKSAVESLEL